MSYQTAKEIFAAGRQDYCFDGPYHARRKDKWLAVVTKGKQWSLEKTVVHGDRIEPQHGKPHFFIKWNGSAWAPGPVTSAPITHLKQKNGMLSDAKFVLSGQTWHWIEWASDSFYLARGKTQWIQTSNWHEQDKVGLTPGHANVPEAVVSGTEKYRDTYDPGEMRLVWAGDLNGDTLPELVTHSQVKEVWGLRLWSGFIDKDRTIKFRLTAVENDGCS